MNINLRRLVSWSLVIIWMIIIFFLSHQPAANSNGLSTGITEKIVEMLEKIVPKIEFEMENFNHIVRKSAHFFAYLLLGILVINGLRSSGLRGYKGMWLALFISVLYAISDETHQLFVPGRSGQIKDVLIDSSGAFVGILGYIGIYK